MKWVQYTENNVFLSEDRHMLKADKLEDIPDNIWSKRLYSESNPDHLVISKRNGLGYELTKKGDVKESIQIVEIVSGCAKAYFELEILNKFLQKSSILYLAQDDGQLLIQNKNNCYLVSASVFDSYSFDSQMIQDMNIDYTKMYQVIGYYMVNCIMNRT
jgi:hypothetical protein